jgi:LPXTG-site transpeptidase (sortase) family protein
MKKINRKKEIKNITLLSLGAIVATQAITNADLIHGYVSDWVYGIQQVVTPQHTIARLGNSGPDSISGMHPASSIESSNLEKLIAQYDGDTAHTNTIAPLLDESLADKNNSYQLAFNTLPPVNKITIEGIGVDAPIVSMFGKTQEEIAAGDFNDELMEGVALYPGTPQPGENGHTLIFGHSSQERWAQNQYSTIFRNINDLNSEDTFSIVRKGQLLRYRILQKEVVKPEDVIGEYKKRDTDSTNRLSLITCRPLGTTLKRMVVTAELVTDNTTHPQTLLSHYSH